MRIQLPRRFTDRRTKQQLESYREIEQKWADWRIEQEWRERVRANVQRRSQTLSDSTSS